ncbi:MAG: hypothetical protein ACTHU0_08965 [Kofleriaceae bacterium]
MINVVRSARATESTRREIPAMTVPPSNTTMAYHRPLRPSSMMRELAAPVQHRARRALLHDMRSLVRDRVARAC